MLSPAGLPAAGAARPGGVRALSAAGPEALGAPGVLGQRLDAGAEARLLELEGAELARHRAVELLRGLAAGGGKARGVRGIGGARGGDGGGEALARAAGIAERIEARAQRVAQCCERIRLDMVLARQRLEREQPFLGAL